MAEESGGRHSIRGGQVALFANMPDATTSVNCHRLTALNRTNYNLQARRIEVCTVPSGSGDESPSYRQYEDYAVGAGVSLVLEGREVGRIAVAAVLPAKG
jgi:hypothetical protein